MRVIINGVVSGPAEHPRLAYLSQHRDTSIYKCFQGHGLSVHFRTVLSCQIKYHIEVNTEIAWEQLHLSSCKSEGMKQAPKAHDAICHRHNSTLSWPQLFLLGMYLLLYTHCCNIYGFIRMRRDNDN
jgi:hypothetical protein